MVLGACRKAGWGNAIEDERPDTKWMDHPCAGSPAYPGSDGFRVAHFGIGRCELLRGCERE